MDPRSTILVGASILLAGLVAVVLIARGGDDATTSEVPSGDKPEVSVPDGDPPAELVVEDLTVGDGAEAKSGDQLAVNYVGVLFDTGEEFDSNFGNGAPFEFQLGAGNVIPGWDQGLEGMKVGGRRQLTIPSDLAYGPEGRPPAIPGDSALVFVVDLLTIN